MYINDTFLAIMEIEDKINSLYTLKEEMEFFSGFGAEFHGNVHDIEREIRSLNRKLSTLRKKWAEDADCTVCILESEEEVEVYAYKNYLADCEEIRKQYRRGIRSLDNIQSAMDECYEDYLNSCSEAGLEVEPRLVY